MVTRARHMYRGLTLLLLSTMLLIAMIQPIGSCQPDWARNGLYVEYSKKVEAVKTDLTSNYPRLDGEFNGYVEEKATYVVISFDERVFTLSKNVVGGTYATGTRRLREILGWIDRGEKNTIRGNTTVEMVFEWYFSRRNINFKLKEGDVLPSPVNLYIYQSPMHAQKEIRLDRIYTITLETSGGTPEDVSVEATLHAVYDTATGFLEKLEITIRYSSGGLPILNIFYTVEKTGSNIPVVGGNPLNIDTILALTAGGVVAAVFAFIVYYYRVKREVG